MPMTFIDRIKQSGLKQFWSKSAASAEEISSFENDFTLTLPDEYKQFLATFGCGVFGHTEIYGLGCPDTGIPNIRFVIKALEKVNQFFPPKVIPISDADEGFYTCILCQTNGCFQAGNVVVCRPSSTANEVFRTMHLLASSFGKFCIMEVEAQKK
ncbi:MAG: SMI1/KNR4 family protein [Oligosphaeraceae bacterium]